MNKLTKAAFVYGVVAIGAFAFDKIYGLFGHGVTSVWMSSMYLVPLILGTIPFALLRMALPDFLKRKGYRLFFNVYTSGIAILINAMLIQGILDIAGGTSDLVQIFFYLSFGLLAFGLVLFLPILFQHQTKKPSL